MYVLKYALISKTLDLPDKDLTSTVLNILKYLKEIMNKELNTRKMIDIWNENIHKEIEFILFTNS